MKKAAKRKPPVATTAFHGKAEDGSDVVGIGNLKVVILQEGEVWFAQGLEIDYAAQGSDLEDVKKHFEDGLCATIHENLRVYGNIEKMLKVAPPSVWKDLYLNAKAIRKFYSQISVHSELQQALPFEKIERGHPERVGRRQQCGCQRAVCLQTSCQGGRHHHALTGRTTSHLQSDRYLL